MHEPVNNIGFKLETRVKQFKMRFKMKVKLGRRAAMSLVVLVSVILSREGVNA